MFHAPAVAFPDGIAVAYVGVVTAGVSYLLFTHALRHISAGTAVTLALGEPVVAFALAVILVGEHPSAAGFFGLLLVVAGVVAVVRSEPGRGARSPGIGGTRTAQSIAG